MDTLTVRSILAQRSHATVLMDRSDGARFSARRDIWLDCVVVQRTITLPDRPEPFAVDATDEEEAACLAVVASLDTKGWDLSLTKPSFVFALPPRERL